MASTKKKAKRRGRKTVPRPTTAIIQRELDVHREELAAQNDELRRSNAALATAKERYALLYDGSPVAYLTLDASGTILEANLAAADLLESSRNFLFGRAFDEIIVPSSRESFRRFRHRVLEYGLKPIHHTLLVVGNRRLPVRIEGARLAAAASSPSSSASGSSAMHLLLCISDETERRLVDAERRLLDARVAESQRVESLGVLAGGIAHDFNNILAIVLANVDLLLLDGESKSLPRDTIDAVHEIHNAVTRAADLSKQMLAYTGRGRVVGMPTDLTAIVRSMSALLVSSIPANVALKLDLDDNLAPITCDTAQIQQILMNLVVNAAEAISPNKGTVTVRTRPTDKDAISLEVLDDGCGMDEATQQRAFDPFFSTKFTGRGLGLAVVHGRARAHGGHVEISSSLHGGSMFRVHLPTNTTTTTTTAPVVTAIRSATASPPAPLAPAWRGSGVVLVVDDENEVREVIGRVLEYVGFDVCYAQDGRAAIEQVTTALHAPHSSSPATPLAAVLLDMTMPGLTGDQVLGHLKQLAPTLPVLLMSGFSNVPLNEKLMDRADGFVPKPFSVATLISVLRHAMTKPPTTTH